MLHNLVLLVPALVPVQDTQATTPQQEYELPAQEVTAERPKSLTVTNADQAAQKIRKVPGSVSIIRDDDFKFGRVSDISDVLKLAPSVYIQSRHGGTETRVSVRGSGIRQAFNAIGVRFLRNGIPLSEADGNVRPQLLDPLLVEYAEVFPGANGMVYGASLLGGVINFVTPTGYSADGHTRVRLEYGSHKFSHMQLSGGAVLDNGLDYFVSGSILDKVGFRPQSEEHNEVFYGNLGKRFNDTWEGRIHINVQNNNLQLPGSLTWNEIDEDPTQGDPAAVRTAPVRNLNIGRLDGQLTGQFSETEKLELTASIQLLEMWHPLSFGGGGAGNDNVQDRLDLSFSSRYTTQAEVFGRQNDLTIGFFGALGDSDSQRMSPRNGPTVRDRDQFGTTLELYGENHIHLNDQFQLVAGLQVASANREQEDNLNSANDVDEDYSGVNPKLGMIYDQNENTQWFGNISRSFEPPTEGNIANNLGAKLDEQTAWTLEVGGRGGAGNTQWQGAVYYSKVEDEILTVDISNGGGNLSTGNADDTIHMGLELSASHRIPLDKHEDGSALQFRGTFNYISLEFDGDLQWGNNDIPGIPQEVLRAEAIYELGNGFYCGLDLEYASDWYVDFANSLEADSYTVFGATAGYHSPSGWSAFVDVKNLTDKKYASNSGITTTANPNQRIFNPGETFGVFFGVEIAL